MPLCTPLKNPLSETVARSFLPLPNKLIALCPNLLPQSDGVRPSWKDFLCFEEPGRTDAGIGSICELIAALSVREEIRKREAVG
jgi:hypothetical protein